MDRDPRLPPGQYRTEKWPVLTYGLTPRVDLARWDFRIWGAVGRPVRWTWEELLRLPSAESTSDVHCVTGWSRFDNRWRGVTVPELLSHAGPDAGARFVLVHADPDYTANLLLEDLLRPDALLAYEHDGRPLEPDHGGPLRLVVPRLYFWKSAKWVRGFELQTEEQPGFWERLGYHMRGDPWLEERHGTPETTGLMQRMRAADAKERRRREREGG